MNADSIPAPTRLTKRGSEPPPAERSHFQIFKTVLLEAELALGGGRSASSR